MSDFKNLTINLYDSPTKFGGGYIPDFQLKGIALQWDSSLTVNQNYDRASALIGNAEDMKPSITALGTGQPYYYENTHFLKNHNYTSSGAFGTLNEQVTTVWDTAPNPYVPNSLPLIVYDTDLIKYQNNYNMCKYLVIELRYLLQELYLGMIQLVMFPIIRYM